MLAGLSASLLTISTAEGVKAVKISTVKETAPAHTRKGS
jgi:hypothetical protein